MNPLYNFGYIVAGLAVYLCIKIISDLKDKNRALFFRDFGVATKQVQVKINKQALLAAILQAQSEINKKFITKGLAIRHEELEKIITGKPNSLGFEDELDYVIKRLAGEEVRSYGHMITSGPEPRVSIEARLLYERVLNGDVYDIPKSGGSLLEHFG